MNGRMQTTLLAHLVATVLCALSLGGMVFYTAVFSPMIVRRLSSEASGGLIIALSQPYDSVLIVLSALAAGLLWNESEASVLATIAVLFAFTRFAVTPRMKRARQASLAGDATETETFASLNSLSTLVHCAQMAALVAVLIRLLLA